VEEACVWVLDEVHHAKYGVFSKLSSAWAVCLWKSDEGLSTIVAKVVITF
jgi:hypothetical protein